jgi:hypothetical protein
MWVVSSHGWGMDGTSTMMRVLSSHGWSMDETSIMMLHMMDVKINIPKVEKP